ncbi:MAG: arginine--tRNA ligase [Terriglobia bacterium]
MYLEIQRRIQQRFVALVREIFELAMEPPALDSPPSLEMGDLSLAACFELAKKLRQPPRKIAQTLAERFLPLEGIERVSTAGAGYLNFHFNRARAAAALFARRVSGQASLPSDPGKVLVEHTSINPNKAAHIGHLRNSILGDTFVRLLKFRGDQVEVQNYIDNTGVQVADVVVGFIHLEKKNLEEVERLIREPEQRFDYFCWDLYAKVFRYYQTNPEALNLRAQALKDIEEGHGEPALMADLVSTAIVRLHLATMLRINVQYDLLVQESEILRLDFWKSAFELLKKNGAIRFEDAGKNAGCWVMSLGDSESSEPEGEPGEEDVKIIVRSSGTVTYVGKDIAYHLWKFALLGKDFGYALFYRYPDGHPVWRTALHSEYEPPSASKAGPPSTVSEIDQPSPASDVEQPPPLSEIEQPSPLGKGCPATAPSSAVAGRVRGHFPAENVSGETPSHGHAHSAYAVIDTRQSYLQNLVKAALHALGYHEQANNLHHFAYEVVGLSPRCAEELGVELSEEDRERPYVEVSGRKGLGVKADDLIDKLIAKAFEEVCSRQMTQNPEEQRTYARMIAVAALRYFLLKFSRRMIIAFDFKEALAFEGETGPYLQYSVVRARNIFTKFQETHAGFQAQNLDRAVGPEVLERFFAGEDGLAFWELTLLAAQLEMTVEQAIASQEPAGVAKYAFRLAQAFNNFYHRFHILSEPSAERQQFLLYLVQLVNQTLTAALDLMGMEVPERM